jgi:hypothetical protein
VRLLFFFLPLTQLRATAPRFLDFVMPPLVVRPVVHSLHGEMSVLDLGGRTNVPYFGACERCEPSV